MNGTAVWFRLEDTFRNKRGITLVELLVVLALLSMTIGVIYMYFDYGYKSWNRASAEARAVQEARLFIDVLNREVHQARVATNGGTAVAVSAGNTQLDVYTDVSGDGRPELVRYRLVDGRLERGVSAPQGSAYPYSYAAPTAYETVVTTVVNGAGDSLFTVDASNPPRMKVLVNLLVNDAATPLAQPLAVQATISVRSRGNAS